MSPLRRHALRVADAELRRRRGLHDLSREERHGVEALAASVALRVAEVLESAAATEPALARALHELEGPSYDERGGVAGSWSASRGGRAGATGTGASVGAGGATGSGGAAASGTGAGATTGGAD